METLVIHIPEKKSELVKQILKGLGVKFNAGEKATKRLSAGDFLGVISKRDAELMEQAIEEGCEQIHPDDWR